MFDEKSGSNLQPLGFEGRAKKIYAVILITEKTYQISKKRLIAYKKRCLGLTIYYKLSQSIKTMEIKLLYK